MSDPSSTSTSPSTEAPELEPAQRAFDQGNYFEARRRIRAASASENTDVRKQAETLLEKMAADRAVYVLLAVSAIFLILAFISYAGRT